MTMMIPEDNGHAGQDGGSRARQPSPARKTIGYHLKNWGPIVGHGGVDYTLCIDVHFSAKNDL
jgi:hypothetical protein